MISAFRQPASRAAFHREWGSHEGACPLVPAPILPMVRELEKS